MLVSILMPSRNQATFLPRALDSILTQSYKDLEVVVMDGRSIDDSCEVLRNYAQRDERVRWRSEPDSSPAEAVNKAAKSARGDIFGWLNADDEYAQGAVEHALEQFAATPSLKLLYGHAEFIDERGETIGTYPTKKPDSRVEEFTQGCFICQPSVFIRREAWEELGGLDESIKTAFDFDLWIRFFKAFPGRTGFIDQVLAFQRLHSQTITTKNAELVALEAVALLKKHFDSAPSHWLLTYLDELLNSYPEDGSLLSPLKRFEITLAKARNCLGNDGLSHIQARLAKDIRLAFASDGVKVLVFEDGWAGQDLKVKLDLKVQSNMVLIINCLNPPPCPSKFRILVFAGNRKIANRNICESGEFQISIPLRKIYLKNNPVELNIKCDRFFEPCKFPETKDDHRKLTYKVSSFQLVSQSNTQTGSSWLRLKNWLGNLAKS